MPILDLAKMQKLKIFQALYLRTTMGDFTSLKVIIQVRIYWKISKISKGGMSKSKDQIQKGGSAVTLGPPRPPFIKT